MEEMARFVLEGFGDSLGSSEIVALWTIATGEDDSEEAMAFLESYAYALEDFL